MKGKHSDSDRWEAFRRHMTQAIVIFLTTLLAILVFVIVWRGVEGETVTHGDINARMLRIERQNAFIVCIQQHQPVLEEVEIAECAVLLEEDEE